MYHFFPWRMSFTRENKRVQIGDVASRVLVKNHHVIVQDGTKTNQQLYVFCTLS